jgi:methylmalonyl-CoA mutase C-terminal domain/subunit
MELLREKGADHILLTGEGIIPDEDIPSLQAMGIGKLFGRGRHGRHRDVHPAEVEKRRGERAAAGTL